MGAIPPPVKTGGFLAVVPMKVLNIIHAVPCPAWPQYSELLVTMRICRECPHLDRMDSNAVYCKFDGRN